MTALGGHRGSFTPGFLDGVALTQAMLSSVRAIGEAKGKQDLYVRQAPGVLETLRSVAQVQSVESSNRIEGITAPTERVQALAECKTTPFDRSEQEIAGYRDVLATIHANAEGITLTPGVVLQFHRDMCAYLPTPGGSWKAADNEIVDVLPDGTTSVRFTPVAAPLVAPAMDDLQRGFDHALSAGVVDPLVVIGSYVLDFLCIHPFIDGNGRISRLLTLLLLYQAGYEVGRYVSLERVIETSRDTYRDALLKSSHGWHAGAHDLAPWLGYFFGVLVAAYKELQERVGAITQARGYKKQMVIDCVRRLPEEFRIADVERVCPGIPRPTVNRVLGGLRDDGLLELTGYGRDATWRKRVK